MGPALSAYYNENDPRAAAWLRELMKEGLIADGEVDTRSILDVRPGELAGFRQCHFFAGIGGWSYALRLAGWPDDREVWTGSCPCQPWSVAGGGAGASDPRHLWPAWFPLIRERRPRVLFGEQTSSLDGRYWLDLVLADLEGVDYAVGAFDLPAACVGAPHGRPRLWIVADASGERIRGRSGEPEPTTGEDQGAGHQRERLRSDARERGTTKCMADDDSPGRGDVGWSGLHRTRQQGAQPHDGSRPGNLGDAASARRKRNRLQPLLGRREGRRPDARPTGSGATRELGDASLARLQGLPGDGDHGHEPGRQHAGPNGSTPTAGAHDFWADAEWIPCTDGKARPVEPGTFPLAHGIPARVGRLRGYGNAIVPQVAASVIRAYLDLDRERA